MNPILREVHRLLSALLLLLVCVAAPSGCATPEELPAQAQEETGRQSGAQERPIRYQFVMDIADVAARFVVTANGFPVREAPVMARSTQDRLMPTINTALVGEGNTAGAAFVPHLQRLGKQVSVGPVMFSAQVVANDRPVEGAKITEAQVDSAYRAWAKRARSEWERLLEWERAYLKARPDSALGEPAGFTRRRGGALDSLRVWAERHPLVVSTTFDNERGPDFSEIFEEAPRIAGTPADTARLKDYAMRLRRLLEEGEAEALYEEIQPAISEETGWLSLSRSRTRKDDLAYIREGWIPKWNTDFQRADVRLKKWSGGRVWELYVKSGQPLFHSMHSHLKVFVAEVDGQLKVVRLTA